jgi:hypothetical protein
MAASGLSLFVDPKIGLTARALKFRNHDVRNLIAVGYVRTVDAPDVGGRNTQDLGLLVLENEPRAVRELPVDLERLSRSVLKRDREITSCHMGRNPLMLWFDVSRTSISSTCTSVVLCRGRVHLLAHRPL